jgi:hypothetical protein
LIARHGCDSQHVELVGLQEDQDGLHVSGSRPARILIDDHFDFLRLQIAHPEHECGQPQYERPNVHSSLLHEILAVGKRILTTSRCRRHRIVMPTRDAANNGRPAVWMIIA